MKKTQNLQKLSYNVLSTHQHQHTVPTRACVRTLGAQPIDSSHPPRTLQKKHKARRERLTAQPQALTPSRSPCRVMLLSHTTPPAGRDKSLRCNGEQRSANMSLCEIAAPHTSQLRHGKFLCRRRQSTTSFACLSCVLPHRCCPSTC